jgi:hypothetical protein
LHRLKFSFLSFYNRAKVLELSLNSKELSNFWLPF